ncbi:hypothetical protein HC928_03345 [bacterium]|nr:hypothetical protein [bacterium]
MSQTHSNPQSLRLNTVQLGALAVAAIGLVFALIGAIVDIDAFMQAYLVAFLFWLELSLGCLALLMIPVLVGARWNVAVERFAAAGARTLPLLALLFIPIMLGMGVLYEWTEAVAPPGTNAAHYSYNTPFLFVLRAVFYFTVWIGLAYGLTSWSYASDDENLTPERRKTLAQRSHLFSVIGTILFFVTVTGAAFDWSMSIDDDWFSSIYGWLTISRAGLSVAAFVVIAAAFYWAKEPLKSVLDGRSFADLSAILFAALLSWMYLSFMQYLVIWSGNVSSKAVWFVQRTEGAWEGFAIFLVVIHMALLILLMVPNLKRIRGVLVGFALVLFVMRLFDLYWVIQPTFEPNFTLAWWAIALPLGMGGLWILLFLWSLESHKLVPVNHPEIAQSVHDGAAPAEAEAETS